MNQDMNSGSLTELVFENRNKQYGAYALRKNYNDRLLLSLAISIGAALSAVLGSVAVSNFNAPEKKRNDFFTSDTISVFLTHENENPRTREPEKTDDSKKNPDELTTVKVVDSSAIIKNDTFITSNPNPPNPGGGGDDTLGKGGGGGIGTIEVQKKKEPKTTRVPDKFPRFPGGEEALERFLKKNLVYPADARYERIFGKVFIGFTVDENGKVNDIKIVKGIGGGCEQEAVRVVKKMPDWEPGFDEGEAVRVPFVLPVTFLLK